MQMKCKPSLSTLRLHSPLNQPTYTDLAPSHSELALPTELTRTPTNLLNPMSMFYASKGVTEVWDHFLQNNAQGKNSNLHVADYYVIHTVSPYYMLCPTEPSAWFVPWPGTAGKDNPSGMSRLVTGTPLCLEDFAVCTHTHTVEFHIYHCVLRLPFLHQGGSPSSILTLTSSLVTPSLVLKILSAPSLPFQTITLLKQGGIFLFSPTRLIR